ncbi:MAG: PAS domain S-box protein [Deltaproteobacteria bacterium]|nr:PAS domain S-box protein [Deltaproteobacteria bacterium]
MKDIEEENERLTAELAEIRRHVEELEAARDEWKKAIEALRKSESKNRIIVENANEGIVVLQDGRIRYANPKSTEFVEYSLREAMGRHFLEFVHPEDREYVMENHVRRLKGEKLPPLYQFRVVDREGNIKWVEANGVRVAWEGKPATLSFLSEITERKAAEQAIEHAKLEKEMILDSLLEHVVYQDIESRVLWANRAACESVGIKREDLIGKHCYRVWPKREKPCEDCPVAKAAETGRPHTIEKTTPDGKTWFIQGYPVPDGNGGITGLVELTLDITDRKRAEELNEKLAKQMIQAQKMQAVGTLAGGIAHDFNNILFPIIGYTEMVMEDLPPESDAHGKLGEVLQGAKRAKDLVQQILAFSRQADDARKPVRVQSIVKEALKFLRASIPSTIEISQEIDASCGPVMADATQMHQVVMNLCTNAYQAMQEAGGRLDVSLSQLAIVQGDLTENLDLTPGPYLRLTVSDTGTGMDPKVRDRVFEPYFTTKAKGEGTGLGLSVVHGIVSSHGGYISVYTEPGEGTTFHVYLRRIGTGESTAETHMREVVPRGKERVLLVDDEVQIVRMLEEMLERLGYHVTSRTSSVEALEAFRARPDAFDLIVTDQTMPNMTGIRLAEEIMKIRPGIPVVLCTGFSETITKERAKVMGIREYAMKPVIKSEMARTLRRALDPR